MTSAPRISPNDIRPKRSGDVLLGEDWVSPDATVERLKEGRGGRSIVGLNRSPLARKIIVFNLTALVLLAVGVLFMNPFRDSLALQRQLGMVRQAELIASVYEAHLRTGNIGFDFRTPLQDIELDPVLEVFVFDPDRAASCLARRAGDGDAGDEPGPADDPDRFPGRRLECGDGALPAKPSDRTDTIDPADNARAAFEGARGGDVVTRVTRNGEGSIYFTVATPITVAGDLVGVVAVTSNSQEIDRLVRYEREQILQMFVLAVVLSISLSLMLASTISNPLSDLAAAAEVGRDRDSRRVAPSRVRIPDLAARPDEIGRLSVAMRGMVSALYDRIDANEQFAADVAHEIKNPLASLAVRGRLAALREEGRTPRKAAGRDRT
jgi:two-component system sensor histidine kinase ChvG